MLIERLSDRRGALKGKSALITGAGGGIGYEAAKALAYLGAAVVIAEIDREKGSWAERSLRELFPEASVEFCGTDLAGEEQVLELARTFRAGYGVPDILLHNAAITAMGNVEEVPAEVWDQSYRVNLRAPLLLTQLFLPDMRRRNSGTVVFVPSSGAAPYMGAYEVFKTAQAELCNTLAGELEGTGIHVFSVAPGLVKTETAMRGIETVARKMGMTTEEFYAMNGSHMLSAEEAGCGFAAAVLNAGRYDGQEIGSIQALLDSGILGGGAGAPSETGAAALEADAAPADRELLRRIAGIYREQYAGWKERNVFERQWVLRDFKKTAGMSAEQFALDMERLETELNGPAGPELSAYRGHFQSLKRYYQRQYKLLQGFEKDPEKLREHSAVLLSWAEMLERALQV